MELHPERHAVGAAEVAHVGQLDPQLADPAAVAVNQRLARQGGQLQQFDGK
jgi:hypothetical protein